MKRKYGAAAGVVLFYLLAVVLAVIWQITRHASVNGAKHITVEVIHGDSSSVEFTYDTDEEYLGPLLANEGLISGPMGIYGLYVNTVDGETADYNADRSWWKLTCSGEYSQTGVDEVVIHDGDQYAWTYTVD